ncbi:hypothetical protein TcWFU_000338 [Taenia crassiceps]|uniref:Ig-like domain-containing protein n=1 Tax=Taenia crassiceps TaxID=6207 RepID=A0ABR4QFV9_9CEST
MALLFVAIFALDFLVVGQADRISLIAFPSRFSQNGSHLHLICQFPYEKKFNIMWKRNDLDVGEECLNYKKVNTTVNCFKNKTLIEWILTPVTYATRGKWSCSHGTETASVDIIVNVSQTLKPFKIELPFVNDIPTASGINSEELSNDGFTLGAGSRSDPLDLSRGRSHGIKGLIFECTSRCASETRELIWSSVNSTMYRKHSSSRVTHVETHYCPDGLRSATSRALITCSAGQSQILKRESKSSVPVDLKLSLVGLNIVYCSTDGSGRVPSVSGYSCSDGFYNDNFTTACTYVLCDGPQPPILTSGEQTAIEIAAFLLICIIIAVCIFTWRSRQSAKTRRISHYNEILPSHHQEAQMELML